MLILNDQLEDMVNSVRNNFDFGKINEIDQLNGGNVCNILKIDSEHGQYVLRVRPNSFSMNDVLADHRFQFFLLEHELSVPKIIQTKTWNGIGVYKNNIYELQTYIQHDKIKLVREYHYKEMARFLGHFHNISNLYNEKILKMPNFNIKNENGTEVTIPVSFTDKYYDVPLAAGIKFAQNNKNMEINKMIYDLIKKLRASRMKMMKKIHNSQKILIHNDFHINNVLFKESNVVALIDFDLCCNGTFYIDLIELMLGTITNHEDSIHFSLNSFKNVDIINSCLSIYLSNSNEISFDLEIFKELLKIRIIGFVLNRDYELEELTYYVEGLNNLYLILLEIDRL